MKLSNVNNAFDWMGMNHAKKNLNDWFPHKCFVEAVAESGN